MPEVTSITNIIGNHLHYSDTINKQIGQIHIFILIIVDITVIPVTMIIMNIILLSPLEILIIQVTLK